MSINQNDAWGVDWTMLPISYFKEYQLETIALNLFFYQNNLRQKIRFITLKKRNFFSLSQGLRIKIFAIKMIYSKLNLLFTILLFLK